MGCPGPKFGPSTKPIGYAQIQAAVAGLGLGGGGTEALKLDLAELAAAVVDVANDTFPFIDATDGVGKEEAISDFITLVAGTTANTGLAATGGVLAFTPASLTAATVDVANDSIVISDANGTPAGVPRLESVADVVSGIADNTTLSASSGVMSVKTGGIGFTQLAADNEVSTFTIGPVLHDFGSAATAVATKITDAAPCKLEVLSARCTLVEAKAGGSVDDVTKITKEAVGTTAMTGTVTLDMSDTVFMNHLNSVVEVIGVASADARVNAGDDIYVYTDAATDRSAGQYYVTLLCKKIS
mgnify:CR=1 FL=1